MAGRGKLLEVGLGLGEPLLGLVDPAALEERAAEDELDVADLVDEVLAVAEELERLARLLVGQLVRRCTCARDETA
jgi:hypothetical protein